VEKNLNTVSRQMAGLGTAPEGIQPKPVLEPEFRECGQDLPFLDITKLTGDETQLGNIEFDHEGPDVLNEGPMELEHTSNTR